MRRAPEKGHTYGRHTRAAEELRKRADRKSKEALAEIEAKIQSGRCTEADERKTNFVIFSPLSIRATTRAEPGFFFTHNRLRIL